MRDEVRQKLDKRCASSDAGASPEQLAYLDWYRGGTSEYPTHTTDMYNRVRHAGYQREVSWDAIVDGILSAGDDEDGSVEIYGEMVRGADVPFPDVALTEYRTIDGMERFSEREKDVLILTHVCLMWPREVAEYLDINAQTVKNVLQRAKQKVEKGDL